MNLLREAEVGGGIKRRYQDGIWGWNEERESESYIKARGRNKLVRFSDRDSLSCTSPF
jgi:hypothetical protein